MQVEIDKDKLIHLKGCLDHIANQFWLEIESKADAAGLLETIALMNKWLTEEKK